MTKLIVLLLLSAIVLLVAAPHLDLASAVARADRRAAQVITVAVANFVPTLPLLGARGPIELQREPVATRTTILDLTCVLLC